VTTPSKTEASLGRRLLRRGIHFSIPAVAAGLLIYTLHLGIIYVLSQDVQTLERRILVLERDNARLMEKLEIKRAVSAHQRGFTAEEISQIVDVLDRESNRYGIDPLLVLAVILTESEFKRFQVSKVGAMGLMQIRPFVGRDLALRRGIPWNEEVGLFDPALNVKLGTTYLFELLLQFNDLTHALTAYAHGETRLRRRLALGRPTPEAYSRRVMGRYEKLVLEYREGDSKG
jgi:soluble lytic murein transglycosylase